MLFLLITDCGIIRQMIKGEAMKNKPVLPVGDCDEAYHWYAR